MQQKHAWQSTLDSAFSRQDQGNKKAVNKFSTIERCDPCMHQPTCDFTERPLEYLSLALTEAHYIRSRLVLTSPEKLGPNLSSGRLDNITTLLLHSSNGWCTTVVRRHTT